jgi:hypothetical protein
MSLIDEALKRAQEASRREGEKAVQDEPRPWTPAPLPDAGLARRRRLVRAGLWSLFGIAAVLVLAVLGRAVWDAAAPDAPPSATRVAALPVATPVPTLPAAEEASTPPPNTDQALASPRPRPTRVAIAERGVDVSPSLVEVPPPSSVLDDGRTYIGVVNLAEGRRIELGGIVWSEDAPRALLNDRIVATDAYVEGFTVSKIEENRVVLVRDGMTIYLAVK